MMKMESHKLNVRTGFTLIELLVVIAILSLLVSILLPSLTKAKDLARRTACAAQLRTISLAFALYGNDHGIYPTGAWPYYPCPYILENDVAKALTTTYDLTVKEEKRPGEWTEYAHDGVWLCPSAANQKVKAFHKDSNSSQVHFYADHYMIQTGMQDPRMIDGIYLGTLSPLKLEDPVGPMIADKIMCWFDPGNTPNSNHTAMDGSIAGYNQAYSDSHVDWMPVDTIEDQIETAQPIYTRPTSTPDNYFWYEPNYKP